MMIGIVVLIILVMVSTLLMMKRVDTVGKKQIINYDEISKDVDAIVVLGAGVNKDGTPSAILEDRLKTAIKVLDYVENGKLILSGDHGSENYNEVTAMKNYILKNKHIDEKNIFLDHAGFSTYESIYRAKEIFNVKKIIIVTNEYHLPRALYLAKQMDIEAYGVASDLRNYYYMSSYIKREKAAQVKDFIYVNVLKPKPTFLGDKIPVQFSDGRITEK